MWVNDRRLAAKYMNYTYINLTPILTMWVNNNKRLAGKYM